MKYYMGMDHGTTAISFEIIDENKEEVSYFKLNRDMLWVMEYLKLHQ